jgi:uncharacterized protein YndB with AHSA1/START domain
MNTEDREMIIERVIHASRERVFDVFITKQ